MVLSLPAQVRVFLACQPTDMRKAFNGLCAIVQHQFERDPFTGDVFAFVNRRADRVKLLLWDGNGFWLLAKRLERGTFHRWSPDDGGAQHVEIDRAKLTMLLDGIDVKSAKYRRQFARSVRIDGSGGQSKREDRSRQAG